MSALEDVRYDEKGLVPVVAQDANTGEVLMLAYADEEALTKTIETGEAHYYSRSRGELWHKGETSGNTQKVVEVCLDCDGDALLYRVEPAGPACHTGEYSCFFTPVVSSDADAPNLGRTLTRLARTIAERHREM
ncbi:MAG TPA: phosphoribosyl-AMP cyclohydrolase, partial [Rubrobacteraceae bacterium]|nr:phosphoribosyl-AMP cyclohydrolase [Rubrobacteraceae bacterium]